MENIQPSDARILLSALNHVPRVGEVYRGEITKIVDYGVWVTILPGRKCLLSSSKLPKGASGDWRDLVAVGNVLKVVVTKVRRDFGPNHQIIVDVDDSYEPVNDEEVEPVGLAIANRGVVIDVPFHER